jgi:uncharacterized protein (DUF983 family)
MEIWIKPYLRRDGTTMFYINNDRKVSIGISAERGFQSSKASAGETKLWNAFCAAARAAEPIATGADMSKHDEPSVMMFNNIGFAVTDVAMVGGVSTNADGVFVIVGDKIVAPRFKVEA